MSHPNISTLSTPPLSRGKPDEEDDDPRLSRPNSASARRRDEAPALAKAYVRVEFDDSRSSNHGMSGNNSSLQTSTTTTTRVLAFYPDSLHTTGETLRDALAATFAVPPELRAYISLTDPEDGSVVPLDKSLMNVKLVRMTCAPPSTASSSRDGALNERLLRASERIASEFKWSRAVETVVRQARRVVSANYVSLYIVDVEGSCLVRVAHCGREDGELDEEEEEEAELATRDGSETEEEEEDPMSESGLRMRSASFFSTKASITLSLDEESYAGIAALRQTSVRRLSGKAEEEEEEEEEEAAVLCVPVFSEDGGTLAVLEAVGKISSSVNNSSNNNNEVFANASFDEEDERALIFTSKCAGAVLHRLEACNRALRAERAATRMLSVSRRLTTASMKLVDVARLLEQVSLEVASCAHVRVFAVLWKERELMWIQSPAARPWPPHSPRLSLELCGHLGSVARSGKSMNVVASRGETLPLADVDPFAVKLLTPTSSKQVSLRSSLMLPMTDATGSVVGVLQVLNKRAVPTTTRESQRSPSTSRATDNASMVSEEELASSGSAAAGGEERWAFGAEDERTLASLAESGGIALRHAMIFENVERDRQVARFLLEAGRVLMGEGDIARMFTRILTSCLTLLSHAACRVALVLVDDTESAYCVVLRNGAVATLGRFEELDDDGNPEATCSRTGRSVRMNLSPTSAASHPLDGIASRFDKTSATTALYRTKSVLCCPLSFGARGAGRHHVLTAHSDWVDGFDKADEITLSLLCSQIDTLTRFKRLETNVREFIFSSNPDAAGQRRSRSESFDAPAPPPAFAQHALSDELLPRPRTLTRGGKNASSWSAPRDASQNRLYALYMTSNTSTASTASRESNLTAMSLDLAGQRFDEEATAGTEDPQLGGGIASRVSSHSTIDNPSDSEVARDAADIISKFDWRSVDTLNQPVPVLIDWAIALFESDLPLLRRCRVQTKKLASFVRAVAAGYVATNPFHNFAHAWSVTHTAWTMLRTQASKQLLDSFEQLSVLLAALCHDLGHPGNTNALEVSLLTPLALAYSDEAVLERHHCHLAFQLMLRDESCNILAALKDDLPTLQLIRRTIVESILATDMRHHAEHVADLERRVESKRLPRQSSDDFHTGGNSATTTTTTAATTTNPSMNVLQSPPRSRRASLLSSSFSLDPSAGREASTSSASLDGPSAPGASTHAPRAGAGHRRSSSSSAMYVFEPAAPLIPSSPGLGAGSSGEKTTVFDKEDEKGRLFFCGCIVHAADLSSQTLPFELAVPWGRAIMEEFNRQAKIEKQNGLSVSVPVWHDDPSFFAGQSFFSRVIVAPLWRAMRHVMPELDVRLVHLEANRARYDELVQAHRDASSAAARPIATKAIAVSERSEKELQETEETKVTAT